MWPADRKAKIMHVPPNVEREPRKATSRYFFNIRRFDCEHRDACGEVLLNDTAALDHALSIIKSLKIKSEHGPSGMMMIVRNENFERVLSLPFLAGCA
jgi:hypothetical protein